MYNNSLIDSSIDFYLSFYRTHSPLNAFDFREQILSGVNETNILHTALLTDFEDCHKIYIYCGDMLSRNYSKEQKRKLFINRILTFK